MQSIGKAIFGGGCFWCTEAIFSQLEGVQKVIPGYTGGHQDNPTYEEVSSGSTGHAEVVEITFNSNIITYGQLLEIFMTTHDPTTLNRQGGDIGESYRSIIFYLNDKQKKEAADIITKLSNESIFENDIVTEIKKLVKFYPAEDYHHKYFAKNPDQAYCQSIINPKIKKFKAKYHEYLKK